MEWRVSDVTGGSLMLLEGLALWQHLGVTRPIWSVEHGTAVWSMVVQSSAVWSMVVQSTLVLSMVVY